MKGKCTYCNAENKIILQTTDGCFCSIGCMDMHNQLKQRKNIERLANERAEEFSEIVKKVYRDAFIHGYKHGKEEGK